jgi:monothiol glutaredoxin
LHLRRKNPILTVESSPTGRQEGNPMSIEQFIDNEVKSNDVVLFMKGTPQFPMCGFSGQVVQILDHLGVSYKGLNVLESDDLRNGIKSYSNWPTIPQLYVKGEFVGGCDIIREMFQAGELQSLFKEKGVTDQATTA